MIYVNKEDIQEQSFVSLLDKTRKVALEELASDGIKISKMGGDEFETFVFEKMLQSSLGTEFENTVEQTGPHAFPDIIAKKYFGVEVKVTKGNKWISTGNSVLETTRREDVQRIFLFFGKLGGDVDIKYRLYQECLYDIGVTHSPRYKINMELEFGQSIFEKMQMAYEDLRKEKQPITKIKEYYRGQLRDGEELWWIDQQAGEENLVAPIIKSYGTLSAEERDQFLAESMILFPEIFSNSQTKFEKVAAYLITSYNAVSSSLRDKFTAGGQKEIPLNTNASIVAPRIYLHLFENAPLINKLIDLIEEEKLSYYWNISNIPNNRLDYWKILLDKSTDKSILEGHAATEIFEAGLNYGKNSQK